MKWRSEARLRSFAVGASRKLLAEVKPIFSLVAYRRIAKFPDNQTKRADNSYEDRRHKSRCSGREFTITRTKLGNRHQHPPIGVASDWLGEFLHADCARFSSTQSERFYGSRRSAIELPGGVNDSSAMKKSIILVSALSVVVMALVSCASDSDVDPFRATGPTTPVYHEAAPAHSNIGGTGD